MLTQAETTAREAALKIQREREAAETKARAAELAALCATPAFQRSMLGPEGYLTGLIADAEEDLLSPVQTPVTDLVKMAVNLTRWRDARQMHADLKRFATTPASPTSTV
jgi:hypothetical protein